MHMHMERINTIFNMLMPLSSKSIVIEIGCGSGYGHNIFTGFQTTRAKVIASDISINMVKLAKYYSSLQNIPVQYVVCDGKNLPFKNNCIDAAFCIGSLHHVDHCEEIIKDLSRVSKKFCCAEPNYLNPMRRNLERKKEAKECNENSFLLSELEYMFKNVGYKNIKSKRVNFLLPSIRNKNLLKILVRIEQILLKLPLINLIAGYIVICGER